MAQNAELSPLKTIDEERDSSVDHFAPIFRMGYQGSKIQLTFNCPPGHQGPFVANLDLGSLLGGKTPLKEAHSPYQQFASGDSMSGMVTGNGFASLPPEIRNRIYRMVLVRKRPIQFQVGDRGNSCSAAILRTCRQVYHEARSVLYGENVFVFTRIPHQTGLWYARYRTEVGYTDMERFFSSIGPHNISMLKRLILVLCDALPADTPGMKPEDRRFTKDPSLQRVLRTLGKYGKLRTLRVELLGKRAVAHIDHGFLDALISVMAEEVKITGKIEAKVETELLDHMTYPGVKPTIGFWNKAWEPRFGRKCR